MHSYAFILFSGGLDSALMMLIAHSIWGNRMKAVTFASPFQKRISVNAAKSLADKHGIEHIVVDYSPLTDKGISSNSKERCYLCKSLMFSITTGLTRGVEKNAIIMDGTHMDDNVSQRPGMRANKEFGIISPLRELRLLKKDIRRIAKEAGLDLWNSPSDSCLATRFPHFYQLKREELLMLELAEKVLVELGLKNFRLRPADPQPTLFLSADDYKKAVDLGKSHIWDMIRKETGLDIRDGIFRIKEF